MNKILSWGSGNLGQLGLGNNDDSVSKPSLIILPQDREFKTINNIVGGGSHTMMIVNDGLLYTFGSNECGQLGYKLDNGEKFITIPKSLDYFNNNSIKILNCSGGWSHSIACDIDGSLYSWGSNSHYQLGIDNIDSNNNNNNNNNNNSNNNNNEIKQIKRKIILKKKPKIDSNKNNSINKNNQFEPIKINYFLNENIKITSVSCGMRHSIVLSNNFKVYGWGCNKFGQLSNNVKDIVQETPKLLEFNNEEISQISCGFKHSVLLNKNKGSLITFGFNKYGQLGNGNNQDQSEPFKISLLTILDDNNEKEEKDKEEILIKEIQCGWSNSCFLTSNGKLFICGRGEYGLLGDQRDLKLDLSIQPRFKLLSSKPFDKELIYNFSMGSEHLLIQLNNNDIYSFGWNEHYQLGLCESVLPGVDGDNKSIPQLLPSIKGNINSFVKCGSGHSFFVNNN